MNILIFKFFISSTRLEAGGFIFRKTVTNLVTNAIHFRWQLYHQVVYPCFLLSGSERGKVSKLTPRYANNFIKLHNINQQNEHFLN